MQAIQITMNAPYTKIPLKVNEAEDTPITLEKHSFAYKFIFKIQVGSDLTLTYYFALLYKSLLKLRGSALKLKNCKHFFNLFNQ